MKRIFTLCLALCALTAVSAQNDTTKQEKADTIHVGGMVIIKKDGKKTEVRRQRREDIPDHRRGRNPNVSTNWWILDLGFNGLADNTDYAAAASSPYLQSSFEKGDFKLRTGKSVNVNIWIFMQKLNLIKHVVNLKYGLGLELYNYRYKKSNSISYRDDNPSYIFVDSIDFSKNKLAADYITVPLMLNFNTTPRSGNRGFSFSVGVSASYLYSNRNKQISDERGKQKEKGDLGLERFKLAYIGELGLGPIRLYGSYAMTNLHENALEQRPYAVGVRFSNW